MYTGNSMQNVHGNSSIQQQEESFQQQITLRFKEEWLKCQIWNLAL